MKIFVYEYLCATWRPGMESSRAAGLLAEGRAMRDAALADAAALAGAEGRTLDGVKNEEAEFRRLADWCDYALVIAPEFDQILETRVRWAEQCGAKLLGPSSAAVALCADKLELAEVWAKSGVPTPATRLFDPRAFPPPVVVKPRYGAGCEDTWQIQDAERLQSHRPTAPAIVQPRVDGLMASVSVLIGTGQTMPLIPCVQHINAHEDGRMEYRGGATYRCDRSGVQRAQELALLAVRAVTGLSGYVGVDLAIGDECVAMEINPRLTTSYVGLRRACSQNLMDLLLCVVAGTQVERPTWRAEEIQFDTSGDTTAAQR